jgi:hypothetical protein
MGRRIWEYQERKQTVATEEACGWQREWENYRGIACSISMLHICFALPPHEGPRNTGARGQRTLAAGSAGAERRLPAGAPTAHLLGRGGAVRERGAMQWVGGEQGSGAGDAPWGGRGAPARSAPVRHPAGGPTGSGSLREPPPAVNLVRPARSAPRAKSRRRTRSETSGTPR